MRPTDADADADAVIFVSCLGADTELPGRDMDAAKDLESSEPVLRMYAGRISPRWLTFLMRILE